ncbi:MAG TPA: type II toxin-antitoxin system PemK/MazF family toxin [Bacteroidales bacterium]|nr:type II toxin-antitoxin system PemK/MazF family toxin [Bacteroidales bacterium]HSA42095.1 type II toxin-antitoxin system PemK/MazF family toxin [Bacteroidales bacterium]
MEVKQYQIIIVNLDPTLGSEIRKTRPCLVISPDEMNKHLRTIVIAPITSTSKDYVTRVRFELEGKLNWIALDQIRTIDLTRIIRIIGTLEQKEIRRVKSIIKETFVD